MMANAKDPAPRARRRYKHQYQPPQQVTALPGVTTRSDEDCDYYTGTKDQLMKMGLVPAGMFPGDPGMPRAAVSLYPFGTKVLIGEQRGRGVGNWFKPGRLSLIRLLTGKFTACLVVAAEERKRRQEAQEVLRAEKAAAAAIEADDVHLHSMARRDPWAMLDEAISQLGLRAVAERVDELRGAVPETTLSSMGMLHRRKLPPGWRVVEVQHRDGSAA